MNKFKLLLEGMTISRAKDILGYDGETDIKTLYKKKAREVHPDLGGTEEEMKLVNQAYEMLKDTNLDSPSSKDTWSDIHKKYKALWEVITTQIESTFKPELFIEYLNEVLNDSFVLDNITWYGIEYRNYDIYGSPTHAGFDVRFKSENTTNYIDVRISVLLTNIEGENSLGASTQYVPLDVTSEGFIGARKFKLFSKSWKKAKISTDNINNVETYLPKTKLLKQTKKKTKATKKDFVALFKSLGLDFLSKDWYAVALEDDKCLIVTRDTFKRKGYYRLNIGFRTSNSYHESTNISGYVAETPELLDFFMSIKKDIKNKNSKGIIDKIAKSNLPKV